MTPPRDAQKWQQQMESKEWYRDKVEEMIEAYGWNPAKDLEGVSMYDNEYARFNGVLALNACDGSFLLTEQALKLGMQQPDSLG